MASAEATEEFSSKPVAAHAEREGGRSQTEQRFRLLVESVKDYAIFMLDPRGHVASWNIGAMRIKGYEEKEILGKHFSIFYPREDLEAGKCEYELEMAQRDGRFEDEGWRVRKDGSTFWASVVITALYDEAGDLVGFAKVTRDLTVRREAENERVRRARAEEGERKAKEFLAILGHELRNPLAPIATAVQLIKLRRGMKCDKEIAVLERQVTHVLSLVEDLLDVSRALRDTVQLSIGPVDIGEVLADAIDIASPMIQQRQHVLRLEAPNGPLHVVVDLERTVQVFANLLNNAAKYTDPGGEIRVRFRREDDFVEVAIEDTGIGIAPEFIDHVFELFQQGEAGRHGHSGLGIGLAVARKLVNQQGGTIAVASDGHGRGSCFTVRLPRAKTSAPPSEASASAPASPPAARKILVVDDNADAAEMLQFVLEHFGHEVVVASNGLEGLDLAKQFRPHIAFLDIGLPGMSGFEVVRRMREMPETADIPIVAVSGYARDVDRARSKEAGFSAHVAKPIDVAELERLVDAASAVPR